jgi:multidrug efflux system membrane fusion protein
VTNRSLFHALTRTGAVDRRVRSPALRIADPRTCLLAALLLLPQLGCSIAASKAPDKKPPEVVVTTPVTGTVADYQDFTGRLDGIKTVDIRARASGFIKEAPFKEGDLVHKGDLLFLVDPTPYLADFNLAEANVRLAEADQNLQQKNAVRITRMMKGNAIGQEEYDTAVATYEKSQATVAAMAATRDRAKEYLGYTKVLAPLNGRISRRFVDPGNLVNADNTILTTLVEDDRLYAYFDVDERTYLELGGSVSPSGSAESPKLQFPVQFRLANEDVYTHSATVDFVDNRVNAGTGTIRMRAIFDNRGGSLRSGLFVRVRLPLGPPYQALLIPDEAVLSDQGRKYVYIVEGDEQQGYKVVYKKVTLGQEIKGLRVVRDGRDGLTRDQKVMITGMQRVRPGVEVHVRVQEPPKPPSSQAVEVSSNNQPASDSTDDKQAAARKPDTTAAGKPQASKKQATGSSAAGH